MIPAMKLLGSLYGALRTLQVFVEYPHFVMTTGCYDLLHRGHVEGLRAIKAKWPGPLIVGVNSDESIRRLKGPRRPICPVEDRMFMLANLDVVDGVFWFSDNDASNAIAMLKPAVWCKGGDYSLKSLTMDEKRAARRVGTKISFVKRVGAWSTTGILKKI